MSGGSLEHLINQYQVLNVWFMNVIEGISNDDGKKVSIDKTNSIEWLCGHLITGRYRNIMRLGIQIEPYKHLDKFVNQSIPPPNAIAFDPKLNYPSLEECRNQWKTYTEIFMNGLRTVDESVLKSSLPFPIPTGGTTVHDALVFIVLHETYHIGQMSLMRKALGYSSMSLALKK
jgi:hypothetical protein